MVVTRNQSRHFTPTRENESEQPSFSEGSIKEMLAALLEKVDGVYRRMNEDNSGTLRPKHHCGRLIMTLAKHFGVSTKGLHPDMEEMYMSFVTLFSMEVFKIDISGQGFFIRAGGDHFPLPNPFLTRIDRWENRNN